MADKRDLYGKISGLALTGGLINESLGGADKREIHSTDLYYFGLKLKPLFFSFESCFYFLVYMLAHYKYIEKIE